MTPSCARSNPLAHKLHAIVCGMDRLADRRLQQDLGLSFSHVLMLMGIASAPTVSQREIATFRNVTEAAVSRQVELLLKKKLVSRKQNPQNRREHVLALTATGRNRLAKAHKILQASSEDLFKVLKQAERRTFLDCLDRMLKGMSSEVD